MPQKKNKSARKGAENTQRKAKQKNFASLLRLCPLREGLTGPALFKTPSKRTA